MAQQLLCPNCSAPIPAENVNISTMAAVCPQCAHVFAFTTLLNPSIQQIRMPDKEIQLPKGFVIRRGISDLLIDVKWKNTRRKGFFTFFTILWNAMLLPFIFTVIATREIEIALFMSVHVAVGAGLLFYTLALWLNTTLITVDKRGIDVRHIPIPVPFTPKRYVEAKNIEQLYVEEYVPSKTNGQPDITFGLRCKTKDGQDFRLVPGFQNANQPLYLEREIEKFLAIEDRPA